MCEGESLPEIWVNDYRKRFGGPLYAINLPIICSCPLWSVGNRFLTIWDCVLLLLLA
jgi:hypothetical protein